ADVVCEPPPVLGAWLGDCDDFGPRRGVDGCLRVGGAPAAGSDDGEGHRGVRHGSGHSTTGLMPRLPALAGFGASETRGCLQSWFSGRYLRELANVQNSLSVRPLVMRKWGEAATEGEAVVLVVDETVAAGFVE